MNEQEQQEQGREVTLEGGQTFEFLKDSDKITLDCRFATDTTDPQRKKVVLIGAYETEKGKQLIVIKDQSVWDAFADKLPTGDEEINVDDFAPGAN